MTADAVPEHLDIPESFDIYAANHGDRVTASDGSTHVVIDSQLHGDRALVPVDIVEYERVDHPVLTGLAGFMTLLATFIVPIWAAYEALALMTSALVSIGGMALAILVAWVASNLVLYRTPIGDEVFRFLEWNDHKSVIIAMRESQGEAA